MRKMEHKEKLYGRVLEAFRDRGFKPLPDTKFDINTIRYSDQNGTTHTLALENFYKMLEGGDDFEKVFQRVLVGHDRSESLPYVDLKGNLDRLTVRPRDIEYSFGEYQRCNGRTKDNSTIFFTVTDRLHMSVVLDLPDIFASPTKGTVDKAGLTVHEVIQRSCDNSLKLAAKILNENLLKIERPAEGICVVSFQEYIGVFIPFLKKDLFTYFQRQLDTDGSTLVLFVPDVSHMIVSLPMREKAFELAREMHRDAPHPVTVYPFEFTRNGLRDIYAGVPPPEKYREKWHSAKPP